MWPQPPFRLTLAQSQAYLQRPLQEKLLEGFPPATTPHPEEEISAFLAGIQGNVLQPHGREYTRLLFFRYHGSPAEWLQFIQDSAAVVTTALQQYHDARLNRPEAGAIEPGPALAPHARFVSLALTKTGVELAGCPLPVESDRSGSFAEGMWSRRDRLGDVRPRATARDPIEPLPWETTLLNQAEPAVHGLWLLARHRAEGEDSLQRLEEEIRRFGGSRMEVCLVENGAKPHDGSAVFEPFGFRDGISMPRFFEPVGRPSSLINLPLEQVLIGPDEVAAGGSFLVYRKLRQHVAAFRTFEASLGGHLADRQDPARLLVGRYRDGRPLVPLHHAPANQPPSEADLNDFDFTGDPGAARCPFHAHIRKANARLRPSTAPAQEGDAILGAQFVRRSAVYGLGPQWVPDYQPPADVGLLFMAYMSGVAAQFEKMQAAWFSDPNFPDRKTHLPDTLILGGGNPGLPWQWPSGLPAVQLPLSRFVEPLGGIYLFVPSLAWLRQPPRAP